MQDVPATDRVAVHERDDRDRQRPDLALEVQHVEPGDAVAPDIATGVALVALVTAAAERLVA